MDMLKDLLDFIRMPLPNERIHAQECCISFATSKSKGGLYVDMNSFYAFGRDYVDLNYTKTGNPVYLHIEQTRMLVPEGRPSKRPTLIAIGAEGGFDNIDPQYQENYEIVIFPYDVTISLLCEELPPAVRLAVDCVLIHGREEGREQIADNRLVSKHAMDLKQLNNGVKIPPSGWMCEMCDKTNDLWLNLTDGSILCGRRETGGKHCAFNHYEIYRYPLAVKLGTITADLEAADVYSYDEEETVLDPLLEEHLQHFGIDFLSLQKTELTTAEKEHAQTANFDRNHIQVSGEDVEPLFGPGYTGLLNLGSRYYLRQTLQDAFAATPADPTVDLNMQLTKLAHGLLSGEYSNPATKNVGEEKSEHTASSSSAANREGIPPSMFKSAIAQSYPELLSTRQQDAFGFYIHLIEQVERVNAAKPNIDPSRSFKFGLEERIQCSSGKVAYHKVNACVALSLNIPLHKAINEKQLGKRKVYEHAAIEELSSDEIVIPRIPLMACLDLFYGAEELDDYYSTFLNENTTAIRTTGMTSFPDYLVLVMTKFIEEAGRCPKKLDVHIEVPEILDIRHFRSRGLQPGEELLPEPAEEKITADENIVIHLSSMGFTYLQSQKAALNTSNAGVEAATNWLLNHMDDPGFLDIDDPVPEKHSSGPHVDPSKVDTLKSFGFDEETARKALLASGGDIVNATEWIFNPSSHTTEMHVDAIPISTGTIAVEDIPSSSTSAVDATPISSMIAIDDPLPDGEGRYSLHAIVSHIGPTPISGHYFAHIFKDGKWVLFNDEQVGVSSDPPIETGYMYFFKRIDASDLASNTLMKD